jgi:hypothetical protein
VIAGFIAASVVMILIESINGHVLYPELGKAAQGTTDREAIRALMASAPVAHALVLGGLLTLAGIANNVMLPPPGWFWVVSVLAFFPATYVGAQRALQR